MNHLLTIFFSIDVTLCNRVLDWLKTVYGWKESCELLKKGTNTWKSIENFPLSFEMTTSNGLCITCRSVASKKINLENEKDDDNVVDEDENFIQEVPAVTDDGTVEGFMLSHIYEGDSILLNSHSSVWWSVHEMREKVGMILLVRSKAKPYTSHQNNQSDNFDAEDQGVGYDNSTNRFSNLKHTLKEYKEVPLEMLIGTLVKREGVITAKTFESLEREAECNFDTALLNSKSYSEYLDELSRRGDSKKKGGGEIEFQDKRVVVIFKFPSPDMEHSVQRIKNLAKEFPKEKDIIMKSDLAKGLKFEVSENNLKDPVWHMQHQAQITEYVARWEQQVRARKLLNKIDPYICLQRPQWLLLCKVLRCISRGDDALLSDFVEWTKKAGRDGEKRAKDCRSAWASVRVRTTCDLLPLVAARGYLKARGAGYKKTFFDDEGILRPEATEADPQARIILDSASICVPDRDLSFFNQSIQNTLI